MFRKEAMDRELENEIAFHFDQLVRENIEAGLSREEARQSAAKAFGNTAVLQEACRDERRIGWVHDFCQDVRYGARILRKSATFTAVAILSLALATGANAAILAIMARVFWGSLPFPDAERLVVIQTAFKGWTIEASNASVPDYLAWIEQSRSFEAMGASLSNQSDWGPEPEGTPAEHLQGEVVTPSLFETLRVQPALGRTLKAEDVESQPARVVVIGHDLWQRRFRGDPSIIDRSVLIDGHAARIVGVMPPEFRYPNEIAEYWIPLKFSPYQLKRSERYFIVAGRLKSGISLAQARSEIGAIAARLEADSPETHAGWGVRVRRLRDYWFDWTKPSLLTLEMAVLLMLLIAWSNVGTLLLARVSARRSEIAARLALGATRGRLVRQLSAECILLSVLGACAGIPAGWLALKICPFILPAPGGMRVTEARMIPVVLFVAVLSSMATGLAVASGPALAGFFSTVLMTRRSEPRARRLRTLLVAVQIGFAFVLLAGSGLLLNTVVRISRADRNLDPRGIVTFDLHLPGRDYIKDVGSYRNMQVMEVIPPRDRFGRIYERLRALPDVESAAGISIAPVNSLVIPQLDFTVADGRDGQAFSTSRFIVTPNFFATTRTAFVRGRDIDTTDSDSAEWVAIINEAAASRFWPGQDPIGRSILFDAVKGERPRRIVGIVRNVPLRYLSTTDDPIIYTSYRQQDERYRGAFANMFGAMTFLVRSSDPPARTTAAIRTVMAEMEPLQPISNIQSMERSFGQTVRVRGLYASFVLVFALMAIVLAAIGVYGVTAYAISQRTREIGIRIALGARVADIIRLIRWNAAWMLGSGLVFGLAVSIVAARFIRPQLWGVTAGDLPTFISVSVLVVTVTCAACLIPTLRANRINPAQTLNNS
jgi:putative ABC transport system permease protein